MGKCGVTPFWVKDFRVAMGSIQAVKGAKATLGFTPTMVLMWHESANGFAYAYSCVYCALIVTEKNQTIKISSTSNGAANTHIEVSAVGTELEVTKIDNAVSGKFFFCAYG